MFTGIIQEVGTLNFIKKTGSNFKLNITAAEVLKDLSQGESVAVNGVCLTVVELSNNSFTADVMPETLRSTNLQNLNKNMPLNLELPLKPTDLMSGHIVTGHIDGVGKISKIKSEANAHILDINIAGELEKYLVKKGSVAVNGVSLTIAELNKNNFKISLIPETWSETNLSSLKVEDKVNIEVDLIGKYIVKMLAGENNEEVKHGDSSNISREFLKKNGFSL